MNLNLAFPLSIVSILALLAQSSQARKTNFSPHDKATVISRANPLHEVDDSDIVLAKAFAFDPDRWSYRISEPSPDGSNPKCGVQIVYNSPKRVSLAYSKRPQTSPTKMTDDYFTFELRKGDNVFYSNLLSGQFAAFCPQQRLVLTGVRAILTAMQKRPLQMASDGEPLAPDFKITFPLLPRKFSVSHASLRQLFKESGAILASEVEKIVRAQLQVAPPQVTSSDWVQTGAFEVRTALKNWRQDREQFCSRGRFSESR